MQTRRGLTVTAKRKNVKFTKERLVRSEETERFLLTQKLIQSFRLSFIYILVEQLLKKFLSFHEDIDISCKNTLNLMA